MAPTSLMLIMALLTGARADRISVAALEDCGAMETIEINMLKRPIADCRASALFAEATAPSDSLCDATTPCGHLLPYLAYMKKDPCKQRVVYDDFADKMLELCDGYPYQTIDPKSILVGKPPRPEL